MLINEKKGVFFSFSVAQRQIKFFAGFRTCQRGRVRALLPNIGGVPTTFPPRGTPLTPTSTLKGFPSIPGVSPFNTASRRRGMLTTASLTFQRFQRSLTGVPHGRRAERADLTDGVGDRREEALHHRQVEALLPDQHEVLADEVHPQHRHRRLARGVLAPCAGGRPE